MGKRRVQQRWYRISDVARLWGIDRNTVAKLVRSDVIPAMKLDGLDLLLIPASFVYGVEDEVIQGWMQLQADKQRGRNVPTTSPMGTADTGTLANDPVQSAALATGPDRDQTQE